MAKRTAMRIGGIALGAMLLASGAVAQAPERATRAFMASLKQASCPRAVEAVEPASIALAVKTVPLQGVNPKRRNVGELAFVGGFHLTSAEARFGGLSGLDVLDDGRLLAVSDTGEFVWISLDADDATPKDAWIARMRDRDGEELGAKSASDAEGLAVIDGLALVSFEGAHRVEAFEVEGCSAAARGVPVLDGEPGESVSAAYARQGLKVGANEGLEALAVTPDGWLVAGIEAQAGRASAVSAQPLEKEPEFDLRIAAGARELVGLDILPDEEAGDTLRMFSLHRSSNPLASNAIAIFETRLARTVEDSGVRYRPTESRVLAEMSLFLTIDNFEGIAARQMPDGRVRLYVVSDNNFSASQRTLLMVYDLPGKR